MVRRPDRVPEGVHSPADAGSDAAKDLSLIHI